MGIRLVSELCKRLIISGIGILVYSFKVYVLARGPKGGAVQVSGAQGCNAQDHRSVKRMGRRGEYHRGRANGGGGIQIIWIFAANVSKILLAVLT